jgi:four helix bundle protein
VATIRRFEDLDLWKRDREICKMIFELTGKSEYSRDFQLINQMRSSSGSVMDNIAEGFERGGKGEFIQFLGISKGSAGELRSQIYRSYDRKYISEIEYNDMLSHCVELSSMFQGFMEYLKNSEIKGSKFKKSTDTN